MTARAVPGPDRRPVLPLRAAVRRRPRARRPGHARRGPAARRRVRRRGRPGARTRSSRCGRPIPTAAVVQRPGSLRRDGFTFTGFGRCATDAAGRYSFSTLAPGGVDGGLPFFAVAVFARGLLDRLLDPCLPAPGPRRHRPGAHRRRRPSRRPWSACADDEGLRFDIRLQGDGETVFLTDPGRLSP